MHKTDCAMELSEMILETPSLTRRVCCDWPALKISKRFNKRLQTRLALSLLHKTSMANLIYSASDVSHLYRTKKCTASFFHLNRHSARNKNDDLHALFSCFDFSFDVLMLTETWYQAESEVLRINGYNKHCWNCINKRGGNALLVIHWTVTKSKNSVKLLVTSKSSQSCNRCLFCGLSAPKSECICVLSVSGQVFGLGKR